MLDTVFYFTLNMSIAACFVIVVLLLIRQIKSLPRRVVYPLWGLAFFRLIMPFSLPTSWSLFNFTGGLVKKLITVDIFTRGSALNPPLGPSIDALNPFMQGMLPTPTPDTDLLKMSAMNSIGIAERYTPVAYKTETLRKVFTTGAVIWAIIAAAALITAAVLYYLTRKELRNTIHIKNNIYRSDMLLSPILTGLIKPRIILPVTLDPDSAEGGMVIAHENTHKQRFDNLWRLLGICTACLHWFNPLVWIMLKAFFNDMELSCDEIVIRKMNTEKRKAYAGTLLRFAEDQRLLVSTAFGQSGVKVRIVNILNYRKLTIVGTVISLLFLLVITVALITNPQLRG